ncbi:carboxymuconolactone decarboxylase family protein [Hylemonella gracilis]|jgi:AhpD family alkylhydroperoxidase|uniref:Carboxymuconolactone decarboxylase family protein n=1 Tax=Hylemonella gracilis TaxID=80880 RepID=A0A4P6UI82_9BURK|nr:carboxymuconolactone decarboxylase family protein [Hylemonella gracilis]QBK03757.1 carboxymuconolactone decarboxylase family protein [Hylemonella gracilis]
MRIAPITPGSNPDLAALEARIAQARGRISPLYQVLLNSPPMAEGWEQLLSAVRNRSTLPADLRELVILRVAVLNGAPYEFDAHVPHARAAGVPETLIEALRLPSLNAIESLGPLQSSALRLTDQMTRDIQVDPALMHQLASSMEERQLLDLVVTIAAYNMVSRLLVALEVGH